MDDRTVELFNDSLERCQGGPFLQRFYELFLDSSDEVKEKFAGVDMRNQQRMLKVSLYMLMLATQKGVGGEEYIEKVAQRHNHTERDIPPHLYDLWLDCLIQAVGACDPYFDSEIEQAWRDILKPGIDFMISRY
jgi:hemoglobin-like flavoprotein